jgi:hypothetical protein
MSHGATRVTIIAGLTALCLLARPAPAHADITAFLGFTPTTDARQARGLAVGVSALIFGGEFEWSDIQDTTSGPGLRTVTFNGQLLTPGRKTQIYLTFGIGRYTEELAGVERSDSTSSIGAGVKTRLLGPLKLRLDYRVFTLHGAPRVKHPKRFYAGLALGL